MSVQEQTPFIEYECNGITKVFPLGFDCSDSDHLIVKLDDVLSAAGSWDLQNKSVVFRVAPKAKSRLTIQRNTPLERLINYSSYDNSMLPQVFNQDFDRVWYKLQEHNQQITYSLNAIDDIYSIANEALGKANQSIEDITEINKHLSKFSNSAGYVYARQVVGKDGKTQETLNTEARPINTGGTGATTAAEARTNLDVFSKAQVNALIATGGEGEIIGISGGGTGAATAEEARTNLDVYSKQEVNTELNKKLNKNDLKPATVADLGVVKIGRGLKITEDGELSAMSAVRVGQISWHLGKRSKIRVGELALDGHVYKRVDYPELWKLIESDFFVTVSDSEWLGNKHLRGNFTKGDGKTTFRLPDLNGVQSGSIQNLFIRGAVNDVGCGVVDEDAIRNITGSIELNTTVAADLVDSKGALSSRSANRNYQWTGHGSNWSDVGVLTFDASLSTPTAHENRPKSVYGVWVITAKSDAIEELPSGATPAVLTGGNTFDGSQKINGGLEVAGLFNADIKPLLNAQGNAPISACRGWVYFNGNANPPVIESSLNILSIIQVGSATWDINFANPMPHQNYAVFATAVGNVSGAYITRVVGDQVSGSSEKTVNKVRISCASGATYYPTWMSVGVFC